MLNSEKNVFRQALEDSRFSLDLFRVDEPPSRSFKASSELQQNGLRLTLGESGLYYAVFKAKPDESRVGPLFACRCNRFDFVAEKKTTACWVDAEGSVDPTDDEGNSLPLISLPQAVEALKMWLTDGVAPYLEEQGTPDYWKATSLTDPIVALAPTRDDSTFTEDERRQLSAALKQIEEFIESSYDLTDEQISEVRERLEILESQLASMNRSNWVAFAAGQVLTIASALSLNNEQGRQLITFVSHAFRTAIRFYLGS